MSYRATPESLLEALVLKCLPDYRNGGLHSFKTKYFGSDLLYRRRNTTKREFEILEDIFFFKGCIFNLPLFFSWRFSCRCVCVSLPTFIKLAVWLTNTCMLTFVFACVSFFLQLLRPDGKSVWGCRMRSGRDRHDSEIQTISTTGFQT